VRASGSRGKKKPRHTTLESLRKLPSERPQRPPHQRKGDRGGRNTQWGAESWKRVWHQDTLPESPVGIAERATPRRAPHPCVEVVGRRCPRERGWTLCPALRRPQRLDPDGFCFHIPQKTRSPGDDGSSLSRQTISLIEKAREAVTMGRSEALSHASDCDVLARGS
jgi:hypothetical protein